MRIQISFVILILIVLSNNVHAQEYSWEQLETEPFKGKQDDIFFTDEIRGWYINGSGKIYHTKDGGESWSLQFEKKGTFFRCVAFIDSLTGFVGNVGTDYFPNVADTIPLYKTTDGGNSWEAVKYAGKYVKGLCAIDIVKEQVIDHGKIGYRYHIYAVGRVGSPANFMVSHDNGNTFTSMDMSKYCSGMYDIKMFDQREGIACASTGQDLKSSRACILYTRDGGATWEKKYESERPFEISWKAAFPSRNVGYATIQSYNPDTTITKQHFIKTVDGGKKWTEYILTDDYKARSFGVGFIDEIQGFIGTMNTGYKTTDGGKTWEKSDLGRACNKIRIVKKPNGEVYGHAIGLNVYRLTKN